MHIQRFLNRSLKVTCGSLQATNCSFFAQFFPAWASAMSSLPSSQLGCAQNSDGTLKDASEISFTFSRSPSPAIPPPQKPIGKTKTTKKITTNRKAIVTSVMGPKSRVSLRKEQKLEILDFLHSSGLSQEKVAEHFKNRYPGINQTNVSQWLKKEGEL